MQGFPKWTAIADVVGSVAIVVSLFYVGYEIKRNNDLATVQSQQNLIALSVEMKGWLVDEKVRTIMAAQSIDDLDESDRFALLTFISSFFDLYELAFLSHEKGILSDDQLKVWSAGLCSLPQVWIDSFGSQIDPDVYLDSLAEKVSACKPRQIER